MTKKLTIGTPFYEDFKGAFFTIQNIQINHRKFKDRIEFVVVDNKPRTRQSARLKKFLGSITQSKVKYVELKSPVGTACAKNAVFDNAETDYVLCIDSHVILEENCIEDLFRIYEYGMDHDGLVQGPLIGDDADPQTAQNSFTSKWSGGMFGQWERIAQGRKKVIPATPSFACGFLSSRKDNWLGFNEHFRGFGGEEGYIQQKYWKNTRPAFVFQELGWCHLFEDIDRSNSHKSVFDQARNYIIGWQELGFDLTEMKDHFVGEGLLPQRQWDWIMQDPISHQKPRLTVGVKNQPAIMH